MDKSADYIRIKESKVYIVEKTNAYILEQKLGRGGGLGS
jgi:hypothetical protein